MDRRERRRQAKRGEKQKTAARELPPAAASPPVRVLTILKSAIEAHQAGHLDEAERLYRQILEIDPGHANANHFLGVIAHHTGRGGEAALLIAKAIVTDPANPSFHFDLGNVLKALGRLDDAAARHREAIRQRPDMAEAHTDLGVVLDLQGLAEEAAACHREAIRLRPDYPRAHDNLGCSLQELGLFPDAMASYREAIRLEPGFANAHYNLGTALKELGQLEEAIASYHNTLAIKPDDAVAWNNLKFATKALMFSKAGGDRTVKAGTNGLNDAARATVSYAIHQFYLAGFRPHEADESYEKIIAALPPTAEQTIPINGAGRGETGVSRLPDKVVALLHFGRSGSGLLHSLIDGHPEISTLPSIYLRGYFNAGVWDKISANGWRELPDRFANEFAVLVDAQSAKPIPSRLGEQSSFIGKNEGMTQVGEGRDESLSLDRDAFCSEALRLIEDLKTIDPMSFLLIVHAAFETVMGVETKKHLCFYHIHNPDDFAKPNFLRYAPDARLLMIVREPIQSCESSICVSFKENNYDNVTHHILGMLFGIDQIPFRMRESVGIRLEDLKTRPKATMQSLCAWLGVNKETPSLYQATAQGKKWWGDPSSPEYDANKDMSPFYKSSINRATGAVFSEKDQFVLGTLFYPFSVRFGYQEPDPGQFRKDLKEVRPLIDDMLDFEKVMAERSKTDHASFKRNGAYQLFHAGLVDRWDVLDELGDYPHMLEPLSIG